MNLLSAKFTAMSKKGYLKTQHYHFNGATQVEAFALTSRNEIDQLLSAYRDFYSVYKIFTNEQIREVKLDSYKDLLHVLHRPSQLGEEIKERNKQRVIKILKEYKLNQNKRILLVVKQMLTWHQIVLKENYQKAVGYLKELMPLQLAIGNGDPFFSKNAETIVYLSYFLAFMNGLSGHLRIAAKLLKHQEMYRVQLSKKDIKLGWNVDAYALTTLNHFVQRFETEHYLTSTSSKREKVHKFYEMLNNKFPKGALMEIPKTIP